MADDHVSSAEITAYMRSQKPAMSHDSLSAQLVSEAGYQKFLEFTEGFNYPLGTRKIIARAGYFYEEAKQLLATGNYDSCISFASGFSLLTYLLAESASDHIQFYDIDLPNMLEVRKQRIDAIKQDLNITVLDRLQTQPLDVNTIEQVDLSQLFPNCHHPLFIVEGLTYFLTQDVVTALLKQITSYKDSALILDYWPEDALEISAILKRILSQLPGFIAEDLQSLLLPQQINILQQAYAHFSDKNICEVDSLLSTKLGEKPLLIDQNEVFPIRIIKAY